jgi:ATP-dependent Clp protease ATP-binding subunit ClpC
LQILDDGQLTDSFGRKINFKNTIIIMTSNVGAREVKRSAGMGFTKAGEQDDFERMSAAINEEVKRTFTPEFLNRIDDQIVFRSLNKTDLTAIVDILTADLQKRLSAKNVRLELDQTAKELVVEDGYDPTLGARPLRRSVQRLIEDELAEGFLTGEFTENAVIRVTSGEEGKLKFTNIPDAG